MNRANLANRYASDGLAVTPGPVLVVRLYERLQRDIATAITAIGDRQVETAHKALVNAQDITYELRLALDVDAWEGAPQLAVLYDHLVSRLTVANTTKSIPVLEECATLVAPLAQGWRDAVVAINSATKSAPTTSGTARGAGSQAAGFAASA